MRKEDQAPRSPFEHKLFTDVRKAPLVSSNGVVLLLGALQGIRIIEAATLAAAPLMGTYLAELGADVIKVEPPGKGDPLRYWGGQKAGVGLLWKSVGRNKKSVTLNLREEAGRTLLRSLVSESDVIIVNFRLSTLQRWKIDYKDLSEQNPNLIMVHLSGFGRGGPFSDRPGFGTLGESMSTFAHITGQPDGPPTLPPFPLADGVASLNGAYAILAALYHRDVQNGEGQLVDINLIDPLSRLLEQGVLQYDQLGILQQRAGNLWDVSVPRGAYQAKDGRWLGLSGSAPAVATRVFHAIDRSDMAENPEFSDMQGRLKHVEEIDAAIASWIGNRTLDKVMEVFEEWRVPAAPIYDAKDLLDDPHVKARGSYVEVEDDEVGPMRVQVPVPRLSKTPGRVDHLGPPVGVHNREVYQGLLRLSEEEYSKLEAAGVI